MARYQLFYSFSRDEENNEVRVYNGYNEELTLSEVRELIEGLHNTYININREVLLERTLTDLEDTINQNFSTFSYGPAIHKEFKKDLKKHYKIECPNCLEKISTKDSAGYWMAQNCNNKIYGKKFCSELCVNQYTDEVKQNLIDEKKSRYTFENA